MIEAAEGIQIDKLSLCSGVETKSDGGWGREGLYSRVSAGRSPAATSA